MNKIDLLLSEITGCKKCGLVVQCNGVVPPNGTWDSNIVIIGEAPGADEDLLNRPFCGRSGQLLDKLLGKAEIKRENVFVTNVVKCRPPDNRTPTKSEIAHCKGWLWKELQMVNPKIIITLGKTPTCLLLHLSNTITLGKYVGQPHKPEYLPDSTIYPWYHPPFLLRKGGSFDDQTVEFLRRIKDEACR